MKLYYYRSAQPNFGDELNVWLWPRIFPGAFDQTIVQSDERALGALGARDTIFVAIGTILDGRLPAAPRKIVFGSGTGYRPPCQLDETWDVRFVRGPLTASVYGLDEGRAITDPALMAVHHFDYRLPKRHAVAFMPHISNVGHGWDFAARYAGMTFIDPRGDPEAVMTMIAETRLLLTEAMHGAILADAFRTPWIPIKTSPGILDFKWQDWCASISVDYRPRPLTRLWRDRTRRNALVRINAFARSRLAARQLIRHARGTPVLSSDAVRARLIERLKVAATRLAGDRGIPVSYRFDD